MILWNLNIFFCIATILMFCTNIFKAERMMKERYPELVFRKVTFLTKIRNAVEIFIISVCPILNLIFLYALIFNDEAMIESYIHKAYDKYHKNDHSGVS